MLFNKKFDLVVSLGADCGCAMYLEKLKLRHASYPFDWLFKVSFQNRIKLIENHFKDFLVKENLKFLDKNPNAILDDTTCDYYEDTKYETQFIHDFLRGVDFETSFNRVKEKYDRRIERLYKKVMGGGKVLFVWRSKNSYLANDVIIAGHAAISKIFPNTEIFLLVIENTTDDTISKDFLNDNIIKISANIADLNTTDPKLVSLGNEKVNKQIFSEIKCKRAPFSLKVFLIEKWIRLFCMFIRPTKKRKLIRAYLNSQLLPNRV